MDQIITIVFLGFAIVAFQVLFLFIREYKMRRLGPSEKQFARAVEVISMFINHHNEMHPNAIIKSIAISHAGEVASDPTVSKLTITEHPS